MSWIKKNKNYYIPSISISGSIGSSSLNWYVASASVSSFSIDDEEWEDLEPDYNGDGVFNKEDLKEFDKKVKKTLADGHEVEVTVGEYYEISKMGKDLEEMTLEEYTEAILAVRL
jgi:hypothetical protein